MKVVPMTSSDEPQTNSERSTTSASVSETDGAIEYLAEMILEVQQTALMLGVSDASTTLQAAYLQVRATRKRPRSQHPTA